MFGGEGSIDSIEKAKKAIEDLEKQKQDDFEALMNDWKQALVKQYWEKMTKYVK